MLLADAAMDGCNWPDEAFAAQCRIRKVGITSRGHGPWQPPTHRPFTISSKLKAHDHVIIM